MDWFALVQDRDRWRALVNARMNCGVPSNAGNFLTSWGTVRFLEWALLHAVTACIRTYYMYNWPLRTQSNVCTYMQPHWKPPHSLFMVWLPAWWFRLPCRLTTEGGQTAALLQAHTNIYNSECPRAAPSVNFWTVTLPSVRCLMPRALAVRRLWWQLGWGGGDSVSIWDKIKQQFF
jgi:hypothetical protein